MTTKRFDALCATIVSATTFCGVTLSATSLTPYSIGATNISATTISSTNLTAVNISASSELAGPKVRFTPQGGLAIRLTNKGGTASVSGTVVEAGTVAGTMSATHADDVAPIGVIYENGVADGSDCWVVIQGRTYVLLQDNTVASAGYWVRTSTAQGGRACASAAAPPGGGIPELDQHMYELGHCLSNSSGGTNIAVEMLVHFN